MKTTRKLIISAALIAATAGAAQAYEPMYPPVGPYMDETFYKAQQEAMESHHTAQRQAMEAQQKAMADYMQQFFDQRQKAMEAMQKVTEQQRFTLPDYHAPYSNPNFAERAEAQRKAMEAQQQAITEHMQTITKQQQAFMETQREAMAPPADYFANRIPAIEGPFALGPNNFRSDAFEADHKTYRAAMEAQREAAEVHFQKLREQHDAAIEAQRKAFEERRMTFNDRLVLAPTDTQK
ncbi:MAG: hypothetical protein ABFS45_23050 [Pseudomonadota bacterium]